jgi:hypothetical protein
VVVAATLADVPRFLLMNRITLISTDVQGPGLRSAGRVSRRAIA